MPGHLSRRCWLGLLGLAWFLTPTTAGAWGTPIPVQVNTVFVYRFDVQVGPSAFARPGAPWYTYFPMDPHLMAQPAHSAFPNWPVQFPPAQPSADRPPVNGTPLPGPMSYRPLSPDFTPGVQPIVYQAPHWYVR